MNVKDLPIKEQIDWYARRIITASIQYYVLNNNVISDKQYDSMALKLEALINENKGILDTCHYGYVLSDYTSATGFDLYYKLNDDDKQRLYIYANITLISEPKNHR